MLIENDVREASHHSPAIALISYLIHPWTSPDKLNTSIDTPKKLFPQPQLLILIPEVGLSYISLCIWQNN
jgi:hypothetical protein